MTIEKIKVAMLKYRDFYGGDFLDSDEVKNATTKQELAHLFERHRHHMEDMLSDAHSHLDNFKSKLGLDSLP